MGMGTQMQMQDADLRIQFLDRNGEFVEVLTDEVSPRMQARAFLSKTSKGPELFRQGLINRWQAGSLTHVEAIKWLVRAEFVAFSSLPRAYEEWEDWLRNYAVE
jgi:hypothetical protein